MDDLKKLNDLLAAVKLMEELDWEVVEKEASGLEKRIAQAKTRLDGRAMAGKKRAKKNARKRRAREYTRKYKASLIMRVPEEGWQPWFRRKHGKAWHISKAEWDELVELSLDESVIRLRRYENEEPFTIENIIVSSGDTGDVLFDGAEHKLRLMGAIL